MEKEILNQELKKSSLNSKFTLKWDRGNGFLEKIVYFNGFDEKDDALLFFIKAIYTRLDIEKIGGYDSILSITPYENN